MPTANRTLGCQMPLRDALFGKAVLDHGKRRLHAITLRAYSGLGSVVSRSVGTGGKSSLAPWI